MQILINVKNHIVLEKILWMLEHFKADGVEIQKIHKEDEYTSEKYTDKYIEENWREIISNGVKDFNGDYYKSDEYKLERGEFLMEKYK